MTETTFFCKHIFFITLKSLLLPNKQKVLLQIFRYRFSLGAKQLTREKDKLRGWHLSLCNALNSFLVEKERFKPPSVNNILPVGRFQQLINATSFTPVGFYRSRLRLRLFAQIVLLIHFDFGAKWSRWIFSVTASTFFLQRRFLFGSWTSNLTADSTWEFNFWPQYDLYL